MGAEDEVRLREAALRLAMLDGDVAALDDLIEDGLMFVSPDGSVASKEQDLAAHASRTLALSKLDIREIACRSLGELVHTVTAAELAGSFAGAPIAGHFVYTRLWRYSDARWRVAAGHVSAAASVPT